MSTSVIFDADIIKRYDIQGPRYTSYPTADRFHVGFTAEDAAKHLMQSRQGVQKPLSLYFHLPFCPTICYYCACNKIITKDHGRTAKYIRYLAKEMALQRHFLGGDPIDVAQLHWGGGTPTFLSTDEMEKLMQETRKHFTLLDEGEFSIEVDPRKVGGAEVRMLRKLGFNRMSIGVQDFDPAVQAAVNRLQSEEETRAVLMAAREEGFHSISLDLIYGLPKQNITSFKRTLEKVIALNPDRLSVYNYAHLPGLFKPQRRILVDDLPSPAERLDILSLAIETLNDAGYMFIGMDHFAKPDDELARAQSAQELHRNFQGYSTHADCDMLSFGVSAIAKVGRSYFQNAKTLEGYYDALDTGKLAAFRGIVLNDDDVLRRALIQSLMCHFSLDFEFFEKSYGINFRHYFAKELAELSPMVLAGLLTIGEKRIDVLPRGRMIVRAISMTFDQWLRQDTENKRYSKII